MATCRIRYTDSPTIGPALPAVVITDVQGDVLVHLDREALLEDPEGVMMELDAQLEVTARAFVPTQMRLVV